jgi:NADH-quinone oxidoreductase subunit L
MLGPLVLLAGLAIVAGFVALDGVGDVLGFVGGVGQVVTFHEPHEFELDETIFIAATASALVGLAIGWIYWSGRAERAERARQWAPELHQFLVRRYYIDDLYQWLINSVILGVAGVVAFFDRKVVNETGIDGTAEEINFLGFRLKFLQTGRIPNYALGMAIGVVAFALIAFSTV